MKKIVCERCGARRGRRQCIKTNQYICGECCSRMQLDSTCPKSCQHIGKLNIRDLNEKISALIETGIGVRDRKPDESIKIFDRVLELDNDNFQSLIEESTSYEKMGQFDRSIECLEKAYRINPCDSINIKLASANMKAGYFQKSIGLLSGVEDMERKIDVFYMLGSCYFLDHDFKNSANIMEKIVSNTANDISLRSKARILLSRSYLNLKDFDMAVRYARDIDEKFADDRNDILENAYFMSGRMYELLILINSILKKGYREKFMLLQCCRALKKDSRGEMLRIVDDILKGHSIQDDFVQETGLLGLKIELLFKEMRLQEAYECYLKNKERIRNAATKNFDCYEANCLIAFFLYGVDKNKAISIYKDVIGFHADELVIDGLFDAFSTMDISPYVKAKSIEKSIVLMTSGRRDSFNRTEIAADILFEQGDYAHALDYYLRIKDTEGFDTGKMYRMAVCLVKQSRFQEAMDAFLKILSQTKFIPGVYPEIIKCCLELNMDWSVYFKSLELEKLSFSNIYELAGKMLEYEHYDKAGYLYSYLLDNYEAIDIYSKKMVCHNMAYVYRGLKNYEKGIDAIKGIPEEYTSHDLMLDMGCLYHDFGDRKSALEIFNNIKDSRFDYIVDFDIGIIRMKEHDFDGALGCFKLSEANMLQMLRDNTLCGSLKHMDIMNKLYRNSSLCLAGLGRTGDSLVYAEKAVNIKTDAKSDQILSSIQEHMLSSENSFKNSSIDIDSLMDSCMMMDEDFADEITKQLDSVIEKTYGSRPKSIRQQVPEDDVTARFIKDEKDTYIRDKASIERSEETFQRFVDKLMSDFDNSVSAKIQKEIALDGGISAKDMDGHLETLAKIGDNLLEGFELKYPEEYIYSSILPYYKAVKLCAAFRLYPYYTRNIDSIPAPDAPEDFRHIGVYCYNINDETVYRIDSSFDISCSKYLFQINCHPGLRSMYINPYENYMPWGKLLWVITCIKRKWNIVDDTKAAGLLLLFYCAYKNYLGVDGSFDTREEIIALAGDLIRFSNEKDYCIKSMLTGRLEYDYVGQVKELRDTAVRCIDGLKKIKIIE